MKKLIPFFVLIACVPEITNTESFPIVGLDGRPGFRTEVFISDETAPATLTNYDRDAIARTRACEHGFENPAIEFLPIDKRGIIIKSISFYCKDAPVVLDPVLEDMPEESIDETAPQGSSLLSRLKAKFTPTTDDVNVEPEPVLDVVEETVEDDAANQDSGLLSGLKSLFTNKKNNDEVNTDEVNTDEAL